MSKGLVLQDVFLNVVRRDKVPVTVHLTNGYQIKGVVKGFDSFVIILLNEDKQTMIYKHAISTITPAKFLTFSEDSLSISTNDYINTDTVKGDKNID
ncbi:MAG: RNA chaperone Hfq [Clostridiales bacterium]|nr:RNA chaperone Hfq [Clostridiales bacterium]